MRPFLCVASCLALAAPAASAQEVLFQRTFVRHTGAPAPESASFTACDPAGRFTLVVDNGPAAMPRVSSGSVAVNGIEVLRPNDFNQNVARIERPLANVDAANRIDVRLASKPGAAIAVTVKGVMSCGIRITSPSANATLTEARVLVRGTMPLSFGADVAITVNGVIAAAGAGKFAALIEVDDTVTSLTAKATDAAGRLLSTHSITVGVLLPPDGAGILLVASPPTGLVPLTVEYRVAASFSLAGFDLDADGDGAADVTGATQDGQRFTFTQPGLYLARASATDAAGVRHDSNVAIQVYDRATFEALLQAKFQSFKDALRRGDVAAAVQMVIPSARARYQAQFEALAADLPGVDSIFTSISLLRLRSGREAICEMRRSDAGVDKSFEVRFALDDDGIWRLRAF